MLSTLDQLEPIETERLRLVLLAPDDAPALQAISDNPIIIAAISFLTPPFKVADAEALIRGKGDGRDRFVGLWSRAEEALAGVFGVHLQGDDRVEIGYWIAPPMHGQGFATEAGRVLVEWLTSLAPERLIVAHALKNNHGSQRVLAKLGFRSPEAAGLEPEALLLAIPKG